MRSITCRPLRPRFIFAISLLCWLVLAGCGAANPSDAYGGPQNHMHDLLALRGVPNTILVASHIGLYRSGDSGRTWSEVAGGAGQIMDGLMLFKLTQSPIDPQRIYVLAIPRNDNPGAAKDAPGVYTSADAGKTWSRAARLTDLPTQQVYTIGAGSASAGQLFMLLPALAEKGLYTSDDFGAHWHALPSIPDAQAQGVTGDPLHPGHAFLWSTSTGLFTSADSGMTWQAVSDIHSGVFGVAFAGQMVYASSEEGMYVARDGGAHFTLAPSDNVYTSVVACAAAPDYAYGLTGSAVYTTADGGQRWTAARSTTQHPDHVVVDPTNAQTAYISFSDPIGIARTTDSGQHWQTMLP